MIWGQSFIRANLRTIWGRQLNPRGPEHSQVVNTPLQISDHESFTYLSFSHIFIGVH